MLVEFARSHDLKHRFAIQADDSLSDYYGVTGIPHVVVIDQQGIVRMMRIGSGTVVERGPRLPEHLTADLGSGFTLWNAEPRRLDLEFDVTNVSDSRYKIAKESEEIPIQFAPSRTVGGSLKFHF